MTTETAQPPAVVCTFGTHEGIRVLLRGDSAHLGLRKPVNQRRWTFTGRKRKGVSRVHCIQDRSTLKNRHPIPPRLQSIPSQSRECRRDELILYLFVVRCNHQPDETPARSSLADNQTLARTKSARPPRLPLAKENRPVCPDVNKANTAVVQTGYAFQLASACPTSWHRPLFSWRFARSCSRRTRPGTWPPRRCRRPTALSKPC